MAQYLEDWLEGEVAELSKLEVGELSNTFFFRDPLRPNHVDHRHFYSPADGTILYQKVVQNATDPIVEIKGMNYTIQDVLGDKTYDKPSLVIGIFMSFYDVHINRIPYGGIIKYKNLLYKAVKKGGHLVIATFGPDGPLKCSGLTVERYSAAKLDKELGTNFKLLGSKLEEHHTPFNTSQQFLYCWFRVI